MKTVLRYYWTAVYASLSPYMWLVVLGTSFFLPYFLDFQGIGESSLMRPLLRSQIVLYVIWLFIVLQGGYWWVKFSNNRRRSGLSVWWTAQGCSPTNQYLGVVIAGLIPCLGFMLIALCTLYGVSLTDRAIPLSLLFEQVVLISMATLLYGGLMVLLGTFIEPSLALLLGACMFLFSVEGMVLARQAVNNLSGSLQGVTAWLLLLVPNFDLFFRAGALIHFWPGLEPKVWFGLLLYTALFQVIFLVAARRLFRPCYN